MPGNVRYVREINSKVMDVEYVEKLDCFFIGPYVAAQVVGLLSVLLVFYWCISFAGGFGQYSDDFLLQWHSVFATIGMVYLLGNAILMFRIFHNKRIYTLKLIHAATSAAGLVFTLVAVLVVLLRPHRPGKAYLYSAHSWLGLLAVILYVFLALVSVAEFLLDAVLNHIKACLLTAHVYLGHTIFVLGIASAVTGVAETAIFKLKSNYSKLGNEALLFNSICILFTLFGIIVMYLSTNVHYKRFPQPQDNQQPKRITVSIA